MIKFFLTALSICGGIYAGNAQTPVLTNAPDKNLKLMTVEASCGQCKFGMPGKDCDLAVRIKGKAYFVDGTKIDNHGDAHASTGFCNAIKKAQVQGEIINERFKATYFKLVPDSIQVKISGN